MVTSAMMFLVLIRWNISFGNSLGQDYVAEQLKPHMQKIVTFMHVTGQLHMTAQLFYTQKEFQLCKRNACSGFECII